MHQSRYKLHVTTRNSFRYFRSTFCQQYPTVRETTCPVRATTNTTQSRPIQSIVQQRYHHHLQLLQKQHQNSYIYSIETTQQQSPIKVSSPPNTYAATESNNIVTETQPPITVAVSGEESILKDPSSITTSTATFDSTKDEKSTASEQKPRPIFPWRHDIEPIPRLVPGTKEFDEAQTMKFQYPKYKAWAERFFAYQLLRIPLRTVLFSFNHWKQSLAYDGMYAFTKGVAGIVSNTYRIPVDAVSSEVKHFDILGFVDDSDDDATPMIHFRYPPDEVEMDATTLTKEFNDEIMSILNEVFNIDKSVKQNDKAKNQINESISSESTDKSNINQASDDPITLHSTPAEATTTASDPSSSTVSDKSITHDKINALEMSPVETTTNSTEVPNPSSTNLAVNEAQGKEQASSPLNENELNKDPTSQRQRHPAFLQPLNPKTYKNDKTATPSSSNKSTTNKEDEEEFCSNISEMMIEPLRKLYQSAHESGRDQLKIKLHMRPIDAQFISFVVHPNVNRNKGGREKIKLMYNMHPSEIVDMVVADFEENRDIETTIELQVWITCLESFQVLDRQTGVVLQGSEDGLPQEVTHIVRFEKNVTMLTSADDNWKITDIDDMLGHKAWYVV